MLPSRSPRPDRPLRWGFRDGEMRPGAAACPQECEGESPTIGPTRTKPPGPTRRAADLGDTPLVRGSASWWAVGAVVGLAAVLASTGLIGADALWLISLGREVADWHLPGSIPWATAPTSGWHDVPALGQLMFYAADRALGGYRGLLVAQALAAAIGFGALARGLAREAPAGAVVAVSAVVLAGSLSAVVVVNDSLYSLALFPVAACADRGGVAPARAPALAFGTAHRALGQPARRGPDRVGAPSLLPPVRPGPPRPLDGGRSLRGCDARPLSRPGARCDARLLPGRVRQRAGETRDRALGAPPSGRDRSARDRGRDRPARARGRCLSSGSPLGGGGARRTRARFDRGRTLGDAGFSSSPRTRRHARSTSGYGSGRSERRRSSSRRRRWCCSSGAREIRVPSGSQHSPRRPVRPVLADAVLGQQVALAGGRIWVDNPIDAFRRRDQNLYLDWLDGQSDGSTAVDHAAYVLVSRGSRAASVAARDSRLRAVAASASAILYRRT